MAKKKFKLFDAILSVICVVFVAEAAAPAASIGNSQYFWWIFLIIAFLLPYGMITSELGTAYDDEGGLYDWVRRAFGDRWGSRVAWYYWINFPLWMASLAVVFPDIIHTVSGAQLGVAPGLIIELAFIWIVTLISFFKVSDSKWVINAAAVIKMFLALAVGFIGIYFFIRHGSANPITSPRELLPSLDLNSLSFVSVILFNLVGFEVIASFASAMDHPKRQIPLAIVTGGIVIAVIYMISAFGIGVAIPTKDISTSSGLIDSLQLMTGVKIGPFITVMGILFLLSLFGNMVSWSYGVNYVTQYAAKNSHMPRVFTYESKKTGMPVGASLMNGAVASVLVIIAPLLPSQDLFWSFFALNLVLLLLSYVPMFPAFLRLRAIDPGRERPFRVGGGKFVLRLITVVPVVLLVVSIIFTCVPLSPDQFGSTIPLTVGAVVAIAIGEVICRVCPRKKAGKQRTEAHTKERI